MPGFREFRKNPEGLTCFPFTGLRDEVWVVTRWAGYPTVRLSLSQCRNVWMQLCVIWLPSSEILNGCLLLTQVEELYEAYCLQRRLRDGANKMVKAYTTSPGSKEARESLAEANRGYKEYTEVGEQRRELQIQDITISNVFSVKLNATA